MLKFYISLLAFAITFNSCLIVNQVSAETVDDGIVISQVQIGDVSHSRLIELFNNSDQPVDITGWCVYHSSASGITKTKLVCFAAPDDLTHLLLPARSYVLISSEQAGLESDYYLSKGLGGISGGHVYIIDDQKNERDSAGWGEVGINSEGSAAAIGQENIDYILERKQTSPGHYQDTNNNSDDFTDSVFRGEYLIGAIGEAVDICKNIDGVQVLVPLGYDFFENNDCLPPPIDVCQNIDGLQVYAPEGYSIDADNNCIIDICLDLDGLQAVLPEGYLIKNDGSCELDLLPLVISEILPNPDGDDDGNEFIEIFNPNDVGVLLDNYKLVFKTTSGIKQYGFPPGLVISSGDYMVIYDNEIGFTLVNTSMAVVLQSADGTLIDAADIYDSPGDDYAWALIDDIWQFTNQKTPGFINLPSQTIIKQSVVAVPESQLAPCAPNQYRNPETNRCKLIQPTESSLVPCKEGQYRSEETNRCRNIASDVVSYVPCAEGQERNPATNRCRNIVLASSSNGLVPCKEGQERNPETNRCRNIATLSSVPKVDYAPDPVSSGVNDNALFLSLIGVGVVAIIYGIWEWRQEISSIFKNMNLHFLKRK